MKKVHKIVSIKIKRVKGQLNLYIKTSKLLENFFKTSETATSTVYRSNGVALDYYKVMNKDSIFKQLEEKYSVVLRSYGSAFIIDNRHNYSLLRSVNISKGIKVVIDALVSRDFIEQYVRQFKEFVIKLHKDYIKNIEVEAVVTTREII